MKVTLVNYTPEPEKTVVAAARTCWSDHCLTKEDIDESAIQRILDQLISSGHHSTIEHASFTFAIDGVSRACTHQLVRHRLASYSQQSQRYVSMAKPQYVTPPNVAKNAAADKRFAAAMDAAWEAYHALVDAGIDKEDARYVLPNAAVTSITVTMNARELLAFFELRTCLRAQWEIRHLAEKMLREVRQVAPLLFSYAGSSCITKNTCPDNATDCPRFPKKRAP